MQQQDLEGKYNVQSETSYDGPFVANGDGVTEIKDGLTFRKDNNKCIWESSFTLLSDTEVQLESTVDPSHADANFYLTDEKGNQTKSIISYRAMLDLSVENGKIVMRGTIRHGAIVTRLTMTKI